MLSQSAGTGGKIQTITGELKITLTGESLSLEESLARKSDGAQSMIMGLIGLAGGVFALDMINKNSPPVGGEGASGAVNKNIHAEDLNLSETVKNHSTDTVSKNKVQIVGKDGGYITIQEAGDLTRPYINSNQTIQSIIDGGTPIKDSILSNGLKWNIPGTFRGTTGTWELVVDMDSNTIVHFLFNGR